MNILHINTSARITASNSRQVSDQLVSRIAESAEAVRIINRDLVKHPLPPLSPEDLVGVHGSHEAVGNDTLSAHPDLSNELIAELKQADTIVFDLAMYNFSVPLYLKQWINYVCRAGVTFRYTSEGPQGLTGVKRAFIVSASGGTPIGGIADFASTHLQHVCHFLGVGKVYSIDASGTKCQPGQVVREARAQIDKLLSKLP